MIYIGKHQTANLDDGYMGSGKMLLQAITEHGIENFNKEILFVFDNEAEMNAKEKEIVNRNFVNEHTNYNLCVGGFGGWSYVNKEGLGGFGGRTHSTKSRQKIGIAATARDVSIATRQKISDANVITNESRGQKTSTALTGKAKTAQHKQRISIALTGNPLICVPKPKYTWTIQVQDCTVTVNNLAKFCKEHGLNSNTLVKNKYIHRGYEILSKEKYAGFV